MDKIVSLAKRRGFIYPGSEIYGGLAGTWDYGPLGVELKNNIKKEWWKRFVQGRDDVFGVDTAILMNAKVWEASGHLKNFVDPMVDCRKCKARFRADKIDVSKGCPECGIKDFTPPRSFNMMFKTFVGPVEDTASETYLRPETAQGMFINFKNVIDSMHPKLPFGIAQIGKAFRNEITPGNFIFRTREFEQMEIEYFVKASDWKKYFEEWLKEMHNWAESIGISKIYDREVPDEERAHYSERTVDLDFDFPFGKEELYGIAYRTDFDLKSHAEKSGVDILYYDEETKERFIPRVIEPTFGVDRTFLAALVNSYAEEDGGKRVVLKLPPKISPIKAAVFPLLANKENLVTKARRVYDSLKDSMVHDSGFIVAWDDRGNIGKRYYAQDEIGTPWCVTIDFQTLEDDTVTVRDRDTAKQERISVQELIQYFSERLK
ncbi:MAG: glycine--tRNA ligase [Candidatus Sungbacteria bacterium RIFCSPLOWO2_12_FULL_41_11]|uniref:Glycine--tRNA ligase n=1 Tax=Candidatus Sungbacteria bacterium RIFCSPLOWO2_12_FULL_41_11 TaxID=1802286 RepID=A0A1G2LMT2_9BACT|nr:MAG: glycine--tRNA ligase [Candidatus Sungbacteria bacterium RIFCSPHIGHO2_02_FULL_41_12b]OHA12925.1 MAG: glycine--tRNA ligase [Candidatus Sungbacteria bacterium RIFCSPLOWO2_12_FULL_41_11]